MSEPTCVVTGRIAGDHLACGDCDPCLLGGSKVSEPVTRLLAERDEFIQKYENAMTLVDCLEHRQEQGGAIAFETKLPGIKSAHRIVTPTCRANKGDMEAGVEAVMSLSDAYDKYSKDDGGNVRWHFVLIREDDHEQNEKLAKQARGRGV